MVDDGQEVGARARRQFVLAAHGQGTGRASRHALGAEDAAGEMRRLPVPVQYADQVEVIGPDAFIARRGDGSIRQLHRCDRTATR